MGGTPASGPLLQTGRFTPRLGQGCHIIQTGTLRRREVESLSQRRAAHFLVKTWF